MTGSLHRTARSRRSAGRTSRRSAIGLTLGVLVVAGVVALFATRTVALVATHGISMEPLLHTDDLVLVVAHASYHVGEVVAYVSPLLHTTVLHRIVASHGGRFTFKGDNNGFVDPLRLPQSAIIGAMALHVPFLGGVLGWLHNTVHLVLVLLLISTAALVASSAVIRRRSSRRTPGRRRLTPAHRATRTSPGVRRAPHQATSPLASTLVVVALVLGLAAALVGALSFSRPTSTTTLRPVPYQQQLRFTYDGSATSGATYPDGAVRTGTPVFTRLVPALDVDATYRLTSAAVLSKASGTVALSAELVGADGWSRVLAATAPEHFVGGTTHVALPIDLKHAAAVLSAVDAETGVGVGTADLVVHARVALHGALGAETLSSSFTPSLDFAFDGPELALPSSLPSPGTNSNAPNLLAPKTTATLERAVRTNALTSLFGHRIAVGTLRRTSAEGVLLALLVALAAGIAAVGDRRRDEPARIRARYRHTIVEAAEEPVDTHKTVIEMASMAALARVGEANGSLIVHFADGDAHSYIVDSASGCYRYRFGGAHSPSAASSPTRIDERFLTRVS